MKNLGLVITDGVGYRNYILSDFIKEASVGFEKIIIFSCLPKKVYDNLPHNFEIIEISVFEETFYTWFFKKAKEVTHLQLHAKDNFGIRDNLITTYSKSKSPRGVATRFLHKWSKFFKSEKLIQLYNYLQQKTFVNNTITKEYLALLEEHQIACLFFTHQRPPYIAPLIYAAEQLKINTTAFIFSWDNLASKGRMAGNFNHYLVWSDLMKKELLLFYKSIKPNQVSIVGTPQFEPFVLDKYGYQKEELFEKFDLDIKRPTIFFTCNDSSSENDPIYLNILANAIAEKKLTKDVNLIVRTSPAEEPDRFKEISDNYDFIKWNHPDWNISRENHQEAWSQRVPSIEDLNDLKSLLSYCDLNINVLSTITLDSFLLDKPVINPVFGNKENGMFDDQKFLNYMHLSHLVDSKSTDIVKSEDEFISSINSILNNNDNKRIQRKEFLDLQIGKPLEGTSKRIVEALNKN
jgi:hypothetical protein